MKWPWSKPLPRVVVVATTDVQVIDDETLRLIADASADQRTRKLDVQSLCRLVDAGYVKMTATITKTGIDRLRMLNANRVPKKEALP